MIPAGGWYTVLSLCASVYWWCTRKDWARPGPAPWWQAVLVGLAPFIARTYLYSLDLEWAIDAPAEIVSHVACFVVAGIGFVVLTLVDGLFALALDVRGLGIMAALVWILRPAVSGLFWVAAELNLSGGPAPYGLLDALWDLVHTLWLSILFELAPTSWVESVIEQSCALPDSEDEGYCEFFRVFLEDKQYFHTHLPHSIDFDLLLHAWLLVTIWIICTAEGRVDRNMSVADMWAAVKGRVSGWWGSAEVQQRGPRTTRRQQRRRGSRGS